MQRVIWALVLVGCSGAARPSGSALPVSESSQASATQPEASVAETREPGAQGGASNTETGPSPPPPPGAESLPAVSVRNVGLHVGGGANDNASKALFLRAVEQRFPEFLRCYRLVAQPGQSGTFGVDLHIGPKGGAPQVEQPRTGLGGDEFRACMLAAFSSVSFERPEKPVVVSYSLRFSVADPKALERP